MGFGRTCLAGDAAFVPRPHTAYGTAKAAANALSLTDALCGSAGNIEESPKRWEPAQLDMGKRLRNVGQQLSDRSQFEK
jgi:2-polyprenyl-6-methoxyphenol hydroxylase-like FAD-dependent oxidoreductase